MLEHRKRQVKVSFLSRNSFVFTYVALQFALCFFLSRDGQKKKNTCNLVLFFLYTVWWLDTLKKRRNCLRKCFKTKEKEITPQVRENRPSNNCAHFLPRMVCLWSHFSTETGPNKNTLVTRTTRTFFVSATIVIFVASLWSTIEGFVKLSQVIFPCVLIR